MITREVSTARRRSALVTFSFVAALGCTAAAADEGAKPADTRDIPGRTSIALNDGSGNAVKFEGGGDWVWHTTVAVYTNVPGMGTVECTGTIIGPHHVITAASCFPSTSTQIGFFWGGVPDDAFTPRANVLRVYEKSGVNATTGWRDLDGNYYNIAVLQLDRDVPWQVPAWLNDTTPHADDWDFQVGLGAHNDNPSNFGIMAEHQSQVRGSGSDFFHDWMLTNDSESADGTAGTHGGDTGGPLLGWGPAYSSHDEGSLFNDTGLPSGQAMRVLGVYSGTNPWDFFGDRAGYTLIDWRNLGFIMKAIGVSISDRVGIFRTGTVLDSIDVTGQSAWACSEMCVKRHDCVADNQFNFSSGSTCQLLGSITGQGLYNYASSDSKATTGPCTLDATGICRLPDR